VTLIAAWALADSIVIHADSQETVTMDDGAEYRKTVQKIEPFRTRRYNVGIAGAGNARLALAFIEKLKRRLEGDTNSVGLRTFVELVEDELAQFYGHDVALCPDPEGEKEIELIIVAVATAASEYGAWVSENAVLCPINRNELIGWREALYKEIADRLYRPDMTIHEAVLAGVYLLTLAERTSNYVRGPFKVAVVRDSGIYMEPEEDIQAMAERLRDYDEKVHKIFLACADTSLHVSKLEDMLQEFADIVLALHKRHIDQSVARRGLAGLLKRDNSYPKLPPGSIVTGMADGRLVFEHDPEKRRQRFGELERLRQLALTSPHYLGCPNCSAELEYVVADPGQGRGPGEATCPQCGARVRTPAGRASRIRKIGGGQWTDVSPGK
jgi:hypothetical protein